MIKQVVFRTRRHHDESVVGTEVLTYYLIRREIRRLWLLCQNLKRVREELISHIHQMSITTRESTVNTSKTYPTGSEGTDVEPETIKNSRNHPMATATTIMRKAGCSQKFKVSYDPMSKCTV